MADNIECQKVFATIADSVELCHEWPVVFPNAMDQIVCAERDVRSEGVREVPEVTKQRRLRCQVAKILVAPIKWAVA